jgi:hypothetical protein
MLLKYHLGSVERYLWSTLESRATDGEWQQPKWLAGRQFTGILDVGRFERRS